MTRATSETTRRLGAAPDPALLDPAERMGVDELRALQLERLRWTLRHAYDNVPHYRAAFDAAGVHPDDCRDLGDLARFPTTSKADLRENYPFGMFAVPQEQVRRVHASSGTTGRPTVVGYTEQDIDTWATPGPITSDSPWMSTASMSRRSSISWRICSVHGSAPKIPICRLEARGSRPCFSNSSITVSM